MSNPANPPAAGSPGAAEPAATSGFPWVFVKILLALLIILAVLAGVVAMQPSDFKIVRSATIDAPPEKVFAQVNDFHAWQAWSPWANLDPNAKNTFEGPEAGKDATFKWAGNNEVGEGIMTITESEPSEHIKIKLEFIKPFPDVCDTDFTFKPEGDKTQVTWTMAGHKNFVSKAICMFMDMDKMVGGQFEKGLDQIRTVTEAPKAEEAKPDGAKADGEPQDPAAK